MLEMYAGVGAEHSKLLPCFLPLTTSTTPACYQWHVTVRKEAPISVSSLLQWWICCAENVSSFLSHSPWPSTWVVQCNGEKIWRCSRTYQVLWEYGWLLGHRLPVCSKDLSIAWHPKVQTAWTPWAKPSTAKSLQEKRSSSCCFFWGNWKPIYRRWRTPPLPGLQSHDWANCGHGSRVYVRGRHDAFSSVITNGMQQYNNFVEERLKKRTKPIKDPLRNNKLHVFMQQRKTQKFSLKILRNDCSLFSRLYIACQTRKGDQPEFFRHEN